MLKVDVHVAARRFVDGLPPKQYRQVIRKVFSLADDPLPADAAKLHGVRMLRADVGEYRIVYTVTKDTLFVVAIGKRNDDEVYRRLKRRV
jgi:mRNA interferase RelE/StbE